MNATLGTVICALGGVSGGAFGDCFTGRKSELLLAGSLAGVFRIW